MSAPEFSFNDAPNAEGDSGVEEIDPAAVSGSELDDARYERLRKLGQGGAGAVYPVRESETLALKRRLCMETKSILRLKREFRSVAELDHPNLIKLFDLCRSGNGWYFALECIEGVDLLKHVAVRVEGNALCQAVDQKLREPSAFSRAVR